MGAFDRGDNCSPANPRTGLLYEYPAISVASQEMTAEDIKKIHDKREPQRRGILGFLFGGK